MLYENIIINVARWASGLKIVEVLNKTPKKPPNKTTRGKLCDFILSWPDFRANSLLQQEEIKVGIKNEIDFII